MSDRVSKLGLLLAGIFLALATLLISTQGIFGESFIALILGLPWSLLPAFFEFGNLSGPIVYVLVLMPIAINALVLYGIGYALSNLHTKFIRN